MSVDATDFRDGYVRQLPKTMAAPTELNNLKFGSSLDHTEAQILCIVSAGTMIVSALLRRRAAAPTAALHRSGDAATALIRQVTTVG